MNFERERGAVNAPGAAVPLIFLAAVALAAVIALAWSGVEPARGWMYQLAWYPTLVLMDAGLAATRGVSPLLGRPRFALSLFLWSVPMWLAYEAANFRLANWYYVEVAPHRAVRWSAGIVAFATVLPALYLGYRWMASFRLGAGAHGPAFAARPWHRGALFAGGVAFAALALWRPALFFPLLWGAATLLLEPFNHRRAPERSLFGDIARGRYARILRLLAGGLLIGLVWEGLNSLAEARWIYTVPGLEQGKLFEMPLPGFLGFPVLALDGFVIYQTLTLLGVAWPGWNGAPGAPAPRAGASAGNGSPSGPPGPDWRRRSPPTRGAAWLAAAVLSLLVFAGIDRWTVDSFSATLEAVAAATASPSVGEGNAGPGAAPGAALAASGAGEVAARLRRAGIGGVEQLAAVPPTALGALAERAGLSPVRMRAMARFAALADLRGLGVRNASILRTAGVRSVCDLAMSDPERVSRIVDAARPDPHGGRAARVRVWTRAAERACGA